jgi:hypothetical protein
MDEKNWIRILEAVSVISKAHDIEIPDRLIVNTGSVWERDAQKREALNQFLEQTDDLPQFSPNAELDGIADRLDEIALALEKAEIDESSI